MAAAMGVSSRQEAEAVMAFTHAASPGWERDATVGSESDHTIDRDEYAAVRDILIQVVLKGSANAIEEAVRRAREDRARAASVVKSALAGRWLRRLWRMFRRTASLADVAQELPPLVDLTDWFPPVQDQGPLPSCTAHAVIGLAEYAIVRAGGARPADGGRAVRLSRMFLYKNALALNVGGPHNVTSPRPLQPRNAFGALVHLGVPPETYWSYGGHAPTPESIRASFDRGPSPFHYAMARGFRGHRYVRLDPPAVSGQNVLDLARIFLAAGVPVMCGFDYYTGAREVGMATGSFSAPPPGVAHGEREGGHAVVVVGHDDSRRAFRIRNSFGPGFQGDACAPGYGWLSYDHLLTTNDQGERVCADWWVLLRPEWSAPVFGLPF